VHRRFLNWAATVVEVAVAIGDQLAT
jgi:hypothetical protein